MQYFDSADHEARQRERQAAQANVRPLSEDELRARRLPSAPQAQPPEPWHTWADYGPGLHRGLARKTGLGAVDIDAVVARLTRCEFVDPLPRRPTLGVEKTIWVWLDRTLENRPYWTEQLQLVSELMRFYGDRGVRWAPLEEGPDIDIIESLGPLLKPGDLSVAVSEFVDGDAWTAFGRALVHQRQRTLSFSFTRSSAPAPWKSVRAGGRRAPEAGDVDRALAWLAYAGLIDAGHLRQVCRRLGLGPETEFATWTDPRVLRGHTGFAWIDASAVAKVRASFSALSDVDRSAAIALQAEWRAHHCEEIVAREYLALRAHRMQALMPGELRRRAENFWRRLAATDRILPPGHPDKESVHGWVRRTEGQVDRDVFSGDDDVGHALQQLWWAACRGEETSWPEGLDLQVASAHDSPTEPRVYALRTHGAEVWGASAEDPAPTSRVEGSLLGTVIAKAPAGRVASLVPSWAVDGGTDAFGRWAAFEVAGVRQVMRWIGPGPFMMGSPEGEEGRYGDEGPQHAVTLSEGYWLAETPCTQALWRAVMGDNPSDVEGDNHPVENVGHDDATIFLQRLEELQPGLQLSLPTEAQWENGCRAGSTEARYGELDAVAWYVENSESQTHPVKQKLPNAWGLFDMLGNVWEWCEDGATGDEGDAEVYGRAYRAEAVVDPVLTATAKHSSRVVRGGSWGFDALLARAASRYAFPREFRRAYVGFRLARGRAAEPLAPAEPAGAERGTRDASVEDRTAFSLRTKARRTLPTTTPSIIETDLMSVELESFEQPDWAQGVGQDRFGLFADVEVEPIASATQPVRFRMRWLPPGRFWMGSLQGDEKGFEEEQPRHLVTLTQGFWLADASCTQAMWTAVTGQNPSKFNGDERPVEQVSHNDVVEFIQQLNNKHPRSPGPAAHGS